MAEKININRLFQMIPTVQEWHTKNPERIDRDILIAILKDIRTVDEYVRSFLNEWKSGRTAVDQVIDQDPGE